MSERKKIILSVITTFIVTSIIFISMSYFRLPTNNLNDLKGLVKAKYVDDFDETAFDETAAFAAIASLGDKYSYYMTADTYNSFMSDISGSYRGIGIEVYLNDEGELEIMSVFDLSPASESGLAAGDIITSAGGFEVSAKNYSEVISYIRGEDGSTDNVSLTVRRGQEELSFSVARDDIMEETVYTKDIENVKYIRISSFYSETANEFKAVLDDIPDSCDGIVIDLRNNPGGLLNVVVKISDILLPESEIVYTQTRQGNRQDFLSDKEYIDIPIVLLINGESASASEILAGAVKDNQRGILVGGKTFGKGCVQEIFKLKNGGALKLTTAYYYTPSGVCIHGIGIQPDIESSLPEELSRIPLSKLTYEQDTQLQKAVETLRQTH